jgi:hypothetical protein
MDRGACWRATVHVRHELPPCCVPQLKASPLLALRSCYYIYYRTGSTTVLVFVYIEIPMAAILRPLAFQNIHHALYIVPFIILAAPS